MAIEESKKLKRSDENQHNFWNKIVYSLSPKILPSFSHKTWKGSTSL